MVSLSDVGVALDRLTDAMPPPSKVDPEKAVSAYLTALSKFTLDDINEGISRFLRGECDPKISLKFYPRPPELARIVRGVQDEREAGEKREQLKAEQAAGRSGGISPPHGRTVFLQAWERYKAGDKHALEPSHDGVPLRMPGPPPGDGVWSRVNSRFEPPKPELPELPPPAPSDDDFMDWTTP